MATRWDLKGWDKRPVTFFEALGLPSAKIQWPKLEPNFTKQFSKAKAPQSQSGGGQGGGSGAGNPAGGSEQQNQAIGKSMAAQYGWTGDQWIALNNIVMAESGWNDQAQNPGSGAYGIPQALPGSKMATAGANWRTDAGTQIKWMLNYIKTRYGTPEAAWQFHLAHGWY